MCAYQTGKNIVVAFKVEATLNTAPGASGGTQMRTRGGGLELAKAYIQSQEIRPDGQSSIGRHGSQSVSGSFDCEMSVSSHNALYEAVMRTTWATSTTVSANATSTWTLGTNTVTSGGVDSFIAGGIRVGDIFRLANYSTSANNDINARVKAVTTGTITVHGTAVFTAGSADATCTMTIFRKLSAATTPTKRTFYVDQYYGDIDQSAVFGGVKFTSFRIRGTPDGMAEVSFGALGISADSLSTGNSPYYSSPTASTTAPLVFADAKISYNGADVAVITAFDLNYETQAATQPVVGSVISPDVFDNDSRLSGSISFIRQNLTIFDQFTDETQVEIHILLTENEAEPKDFISLFVPAAKLGNVTAPLGGDGAMVETCNWTAGMKEGTTGYDTTMLTISTSVV